MPSNEDFFQVFGHISIFFATWDFFVTAIIIRIVHAHYKLPDLSGLTLGQKLRYLEGLKPEQSLNASVLARIQSALPQAIEMSKQRNRFIHDQWVFSPDNIKKGCIDRIPLKVVAGAGHRTFSLEAETYSLSHLYEFLGKIGDQQKAFHEFLNELSA